jgi:hypothetical protein
MNRLFGFMMFALAFALALRENYVHAHGTPIQVGVAENRLTVGGGFTDTLGFAPIVFAENDDDGEPFITTNLSGFGPATLWEIPGYNISGLAENSGLFIEPIARPVLGADPAEDRVLWYWNPATESVDVADSATRLQIRKTPTLHTTLLANSEVAPPPLQLAAPLASDMGFHNHLVFYAIDELAPAGAYGFFARLTSNLYEPSEPLLLMFNHGVFDYEQMTEAALAINAAAVDGLPGDFNHDGHVDAADYTVWRNGLGTTQTTEQYEIWRTHFGQSNNGGLGAGGSVSTAPEPGSLALVICGAAILLTSIRSSWIRIRVSYLTR